MKYEWRCHCGLLVEVERPASQYREPPYGIPADCPGAAEPCAFRRAITEPPSVPFQQLRNHGIFGGDPNSDGKGSDF